MSHLVTVKTKMTNMVCAERAARNLDWELDFSGNVKVYLGDRQEQGFGSFKIPSWHKPVLLTQDGRLLYDNYNGHWGDEKELNKFRQGYASEVAIEEMTRKGYRLASQQKVALSDFTEEQATQLVFTK